MDCKTTELIENHNQAYQRHEKCHGGEGPIMLKDLIGAQKKKQFIHDDIVPPGSTFGFHQHKTLWFCGDPEPDWVLGNAFSKIEVQEFPDFELEDMAVAMIRMKNGAMLELEASWAGNREGESISTRLYGTKGGLLMRSGSKTQLFLEMDGKLANVELVEGQFGNSPLGPKTNVRQAFLDAILNDTEVPCAPAQGLTISRILDAIYASATSGAPVKFEQQETKGNP